MDRLASMTADEERVIITSKILSASTIGFLASKFLVTVNLSSAVLFSALITTIDIIATRFIKADKLNRSLISSVLAFTIATTLTNHIGTIVLMSAIKITLCLTITQLVLATFGAGLLMSSFSTLASIATYKLLEKV